jgi:hypothetical protein
MQTLAGQLVPTCRLLRLVFMGPYITCKVANIIYLYIIV